MALLFTLNSLPQNQTLCSPEGSLTSRRARVRSRRGPQGRAWDPQHHQPNTGVDLIKNKRKAHAEYLTWPLMDVGQYPCLSSSLTWILGGNHNMSQQTIGKHEFLPLKLSNEAK